MSTQSISQDARIIGRRREYNAASESYGPWANIAISPCETKLPICLSRGGKLVFRQNVLTPQEQTTLTTAMQNCKLFRQYSFGETYAEPRSHVLLSSKIKSSDKMNGSSQGNPGYAYHGISMKAYPLDQMPEVERLANRLARLYGVDEWSTGVDLIAYKDGEDRIGWHADDTQGEALVVCVVVSCPEPRPLRIRPKKRFRPLSDGDEEIEIIPSDGDAYDMDGVMQIGYEHSLPQKAAHSSHRFAIVLRNGDVGNVSQDSGQEVINMSPPQHFASYIENPMQYPPNRELDLITLMKRVRYKHPTVTFGQAECLEEGKCYNRRFLYSIYAHRADQRGVNGNKTMGSDSIVVSRQSSELREEDGLGWLLYTSSRQQGALALCISHKNKSPIRVFRSSRLESEYSPPPLNLNNQKCTSYRYDGLYQVIKVFDVEGNATDKEIPCGIEQYTFVLDRLPANNQEKYHNELSLDDLCHKINLARLDTNECFAVPRPCPYYDQLSMDSNIATEGDRKKVSSPPTLDIVLNPNTQLDRQYPNSQDHLHSNTNNNFLSNTPTQYSTNQNLLQQPINISHALCPHDFFSATLGTLQSTYHFGFGCHELYQSRSQVPIHLSVSTTSQHPIASSILMPIVYQYPDYEGMTHFAFLPPLNAQLSVENLNDDSETKTFPSPVTKNHMTFKPGHPITNAPAVSHIDPGVKTRGSNKAPATRTIKTEMVKKSGNKTLRDEKAQEKKDLKKLVRQLKHDDKKERQQMMRKKKDLETYVSPVGGIIENTLACKKTIRTAEKRKRSKSPKRKKLRDDEAQEKRDMKKIVMHLEADYTREKLKKMHVSITPDAEQDLAAYALRIQKKLLVVFKKKSNTKRPQRKMSKKVLLGIINESSRTVCIKKPQQKAPTQEIKKTTEPKPTERTSTNEHRQTEMKLQPKVANETPKPRCSTSQPKNSKRTILKKPSPKAVKKSRQNQFKNTKIVRKVQRDLKNNAKGGRPIIPRFQSDQKKGKKSLTPHLIAVGPGMTRGKNIDLKVTVTFKI